MLVVIEGADRAGKSTLASTLAMSCVVRSSNTSVVHRSKPSAHPLEEYETFLDTYVPGGGSLILDRWHWGERVWPRVFNRDTDYDEAMLRHTEMYLRSRGAITVYAERFLLADWDADLRANGEPIDGSNGLPLALELYNQCKAAGYGDHVGYDFTAHDMDAAAAKIVRHAEAAELVVAPLHDITSEWLGDPFPSTLLVGDRFGSFRAGSPNVPFAPYRGTCGHYLMEALAIDNAWRDVAIINATRGDGTPEQIPAIWRTMGRPRIIAMGRESQRRLHDLTFGGAIPDEAWDAVPHPQYWRRFQRKAGLGAYHETFKEAGL